MRRLTLLFVLCALLLGPMLAGAATVNVWLMLNAGANNTGLAASVLVTVRAGDNSTYIASTNTPGAANIGGNGGTATSVSAFTEIGTSGIYKALAVIDSSKFPLDCEYSITGTSVAAVAMIGVERASQINDGYTATRAASLDNLNATVSSRSTYAGADTSGTTTLLNRLPAPLTVNGSGQVQVDLTQPLTGTGGWTTVNLLAVFQSAWSYGWGKQSADATGFKLFAPDNTTIFKTWTLSPVLTTAQSSSRQ